MHDDGCGLNRGQAELDERAGCARELTRENAEGVRGCDAVLRSCLRGARAKSLSTRIKHRWADSDDDSDCCTREFVHTFVKRQSVSFDFGIDYFNAPACSVVCGRHP